MRDFVCPNCGQQLAFENSVCLSCRSALGFSLGERALVVIGDPPSDEAIDHVAGVVDSDRFRLCDNLHVAQCNWLVDGDASGPGLCVSCKLTRTRPNDTDTDGLAAFAEAETAKRRLIFELVELGLPIVGRDEDPERGLAFDLLSSRTDDVLTGHMNGVVTLDLAEADDPHREQLRVEMAEPYRTLLGHFRHETGHYYFSVLVADDAALQRFRDLFGDPFADYQAALDRSERNDLVVQMMNHAAEQLPAFPLYYDLTVVAHGAALEGPLPGAPDGLEFWNIHEWEWR